MTGFDILPKSRGIDERNLRKAIAAARVRGTTTVLNPGALLLGAHTADNDDVVSLSRS